MFDREYSFKGRHAFEVDQLRQKFDSPESKAVLFNRNIDIYINAPLIGFLYGRTAEVDNLKNPEKNEPYTEKIMGDRIIASKNDLLFNYRLIMLLDSEYEPDEEKRIDKAFRNTEDNPDDIAHFESYVRGGVDVLYEKLIKGAEKPEDYINNLYDFVEEFQDRFNSEVSED